MEKSVEAGLSALRSQFEADGFCLTPPVIPAGLIERVVPRMDAVIAGEYETGVEPVSRRWSPGDPPEKLCKIDQPHLCDRTIFELISHPTIGRRAAAITGARRVQVWAVQLLLKPPGGSALGNIGWHQDMQHWKGWWRGEVFTAWVALGDITPECGPMSFVRGSHRWGLNEAKSFFLDPDHEAQQEAIPRPGGAAWEESPALLSAGGVSFHHALIYHGSRPNCSDRPRRSFAVHLRTERSWPLDTASHYYTAHLNEPDVCPVIHEAS
jgi:hypothetical protein